MHQPLSHAETHPVDTPGIGHDDPEPQATWFIGLAGAVIFTAIVLAVSVLFFGTRGEVVTKEVVNVQSREREVLRSEQLALVSQYGRYTFTDPNGKEVQRTRIPVTEAMSLILKEGKLGAPAK